MPSIGPLEILLVAVIALIVFGPERLPEIARTIGKTASQLRRMASEVKEEFEMGLDLDADDDDGIGATEERDDFVIANDRTEPPGSWEADTADPDDGWSLDEGRRAGDDGTEAAARDDVAVERDSEGAGAHVSDATENPPALGDPPRDGAATARSESPGPGDV